MLNPKKFLKDKTVLVTGGAGFIGSHLCDRLLDYGAKVICFDNLSTGSKAYVDAKRSDKNFVFIYGDVNRMADVKKPFERNKIDYVLHYAALVGVRRTVEEPLKVLGDIEGIKNILELSSRHKIRKIVYASSSEIYGNNDRMPLHEDNSFYDVKMPYAMVKSAGENYFRTYWEIRGLPMTILRFFNVYGPRQASSSYGFVTGIFISQVLQNINPTIFYDGKHTRDFMFVADNIEASIQALINKKTDGYAINLGTGAETSILELAQRIIKLNGNNLEPSLMHKRKLSFEVQRRIADISRMTKLLGFAPKYSLDDGLKITYAWYKENPQYLKRGAPLTYAHYRRQTRFPRKKQKLNNGNNAR